MELEHWVESRFDRVRMDQTGIISGTPTVDGTKTITIKVTDSTGTSKTKDFTLTIAKGSTPPPPPPQPASLTITTASLPSGIVGTAYTATVAATGGTGNRTWSVSSGILPAELSLNKDTGVVSGTPMTPGTSIFTVRVQDSGNPQQIDQKPFNFTTTAVPPPPPPPSCGTNCLSVSNAPASVEEKFVANPGNTFAGAIPGGISINWVEPGSTTLHGETLSILESDASTDRSIQYSSIEAAANSDVSIWKCAGLCPGLTISRSAGTATFVNVVLVPEVNAPQSVTLNGTLTFTPF